MGYTWNGIGYDTDWHRELPGGGVDPEKDWQANAEYAAANNTQNPYTNEAGASPFDKSGLTPGNESGSTLPPVAGVASQTPAYAQWGLYRGPARPSAPARPPSVPYSSFPTPTGSDPMYTIEPWLQNGGPTSGHPSGGSAGRGDVTPESDIPDILAAVQDMLGVPDSSSASSGSPRPAMAFQSSGLSPAPASASSGGSALDDILALLDEGAMPSSARRRLDELLR